MDAGQTVLSFSRTEALTCPGLILLDGGGGPHPFSRLHVTFKVFLRNKEEGTGCGFSLPTSARQCTAPYLAGGRVYISFWPLAPVRTPILALEALSLPRE